MRDSIQVGFTVTLLDGGLPDVTGRVEVMIGSYGSPGRLYGPPENCYPPDPPEWDLGGVELPAGDDGGPASQRTYFFKQLDEREAGPKWLADQIRAAIAADPRMDEEIAEAIVEHQHDAIADYYERRAAE